MPTPRQSLLNRHELATFLGVTLRTLDRWRRDTKLNFPEHYSTPGGPRWKADEIDRWIDNRPTRWRTITSAKACDKSSAAAPLEAPDLTQ